ncbi:MAG: hypothetical protein K9N49_10370 [Candidatus Marinimicrobia bacterium]|nr:hypothetical protein [Candidatus Neomarinimicrobiota bacterium]
MKKNLFKRWLWVSCVAGGCLLGQPSQAAEPAAPDNFVFCENHGGAGFFWLESSTGQVWWANPFTYTWVRFGAPPDAQPGPPGTYRAEANRSGDGVFVMNVRTGEAWWSRGQDWHPFGVPPDAAPASAPKPQRS